MSNFLNNLPTSITKIFEILRGGKLSKIDDKPINANWKELKRRIYYTDGSLRDIYIQNTNIEDDEKWCEFVNRNYIVSWFNGLEQIQEDKINFEVVKGYLNLTHDLCSSAYVFIDEIQINNHFFSNEIIENDIDPRQINSIQDHEKIINYMIHLSTLLNKSVILTPESEPETLLIKVTNNNVEYI